MTEELQATIERLHAFSQSWNDDEVGHLTGKDLRLVVEHLRGAEAAPVAGVINKTFNQRRFCIDR
ncbi:hypothetical protein [Sphingomonas sp. TZW2008]|uniref:hypothetical protein n=1 Tax=Sphingomonas sp. TZW2008 TaxID=1917973 RepID=UPI000A26DE8A|nr:hypothetical protein [Sphingomonas sp. TZW2008]